MVRDIKQAVDMPERNLSLHPLDPLSYEEITLASSIVKNGADLGKELLFETIMLKEPPKEQVLSFTPGKHFSRNVFIVVLNYKKGKLYELDISLDQQEILRCEHIPDVQPAFMFGDIDMDFNEWESSIKHDPRFVEALKKRGIDDPDLVMIDPWPISNFGIKDEEGKRLAIGRCWVRREPTDNGYARPIEGLSPILDLNKNTILEIQDFGIVPIPPDDGNYSTKYQKKYRSDLKPIEITQPEGPRFVVDG